MRILIMVLSSEKPPYKRLMEAQQDTWDSMEVENIYTVYYYANPQVNSVTPIYGNVSWWYEELELPASDEYNMMHWKFKLALDEIEKTTYDLIFRTNSSSYVDKKELLKFAATLPKQKCYCGIEGGTYASGAGFFISRDCAEILAEELTDDPHGAEDILIGHTLARHGIQNMPGAIRCDMDNLQSDIKDTYHYRCKVSKDGERIDDEIMHKIFEYKKAK